MPDFRFRAYYILNAARNLCQELDLQLSLFIKKGFWARFTYFFYGNKLVFFIKSYTYP